MTQQQNHITLGAQCRDRVTSWEGTATARIEYLDGRVEFMVTPRMTTDGRLRRARVFPEAQLQVIGDTINLQPTTSDINYKGGQYQPTAQQ